MDSVGVRNQQAPALKGFVAPVKNHSFALIIHHEEVDSVLVRLPGPFRRPHDRPVK